MEIEYLRKGGVSLIYTFILKVRERNELIVGEIIYSYTTKIVIFQHRSGKIDEKQCTIKSYTIEKSSKNKKKTNFNSLQDNHPPKLAQN